MTARERFHATMHYQPRDRAPIMNFGFWDETLDVWDRQGMPGGEDPDVLFGIDPQWISAPINVGLCPSFVAEVLEDRGDTEVVRDSDGVIKEQSKAQNSIPRYLEHTLKDRDSWEREFRPRLNPADPRRYPAAWDEYLVRYNDPARDYPLGVDVGSLYGWLRNWAGLEGLSMLIYDDHALFEDMVDTIADTVIATITPALEAGIRFDYAAFWEDMCFRGGPLLSPSMFRETLGPRYRRITDVLRAHGVDIVIVDCDGDITQLVPLWLEAGVNTMFPIEVGVWKHDPVALRKTFGQDMRMIGGVSKHLLAGPQAGITREVERLAPLVEEGGYIPTPDHRLPPDVSLENYLFYLGEARRVWGKDAPSLLPMASLDTDVYPDVDEYAWRLAD